MTEPYKPWRTPYKVFADHRTSNSFLVFDEKMNFFADTTVRAKDATARKIEVAVNTYDELVEVLRRCALALADIEASKRKGYIEMAIKMTTKVLKKVKEQTP